MKTISIVSAFALIALLASASSCKRRDIGIINVDSTALHVGIAAEVRKAPIFPVERPGVDNSAPLSGAHITIRREPGGVIGQAVSDSSGKFFVELAPATYTLIPERFDNQPFPSPPQQQQVVVPSGGITTVRFEYDTGIR